MERVLLSGELRIVMIGKTGVGKSAVGNAILANKKAFSSRFSDKPVTTECQRQGMTCDNRLISVVDTPGIIDTHRSESEISKEIAECINYSCPGPHVFLLIVQIGRFTKEDENSVKALQKLFGQRADKYMIVLFTRGDDLEDNETIEDYVQNADAALKEVIQRCGGRYHVFNNMSTDRKQVDDLIKKIDGMVAENGGNHYTREIYKKVPEYGNCVCL